VSLSKPQMAAQVEVDRRIDVAAAGAHDQPLQRRHAHGGIDAGAVANGRGAGAVAQVQRDQVAVLSGLPSIRGALGDIVVRGAVKAVAAHPVLAVEVLGNRIAVGGARHGLMESGVEHGHLRHAGNSSRATRMPSRLAGLCSGASGIIAGWRR
jgi:hypothetical protein